MTDAVQLLAVMDSASRPISPVSADSALPANGPSEDGAEVTWISRSSTSDSATTSSTAAANMNTGLQPDPCNSTEARDGRVRSVVDTTVTPEHDPTVTNANTVRVRARRGSKRKRSASRSSRHSGAASPCGVDSAALAARPTSACSSRSGIAFADDDGKSLQDGKVGSTDDLFLPSEANHRSTLALATQHAQPVASRRSGHFLSHAANKAARSATSFALLPVRLGVHAVYGVRTAFLRLLHFLYCFFYRLLRMAVCLVTRRSFDEIDGRRRMPLAVGFERRPARPPSPDLSQLTDEEKRLLTSTLDRLKTESEKELLRIQRAEDQLQVFATQGAAFFSDFDVVCDACLQVKQCVEVPGVNRNEKLLICSECMVPLLSGAWYHGMDPLETVNVCTGLIEKAGTPSPGNSSLASPQVNMDDSQFEPEQPMKLLQLAETAPPVDEPIDSETEFEQACDAIAAKRRESMSERHGACSPSLPGECGDAAEDTRSPTESLTASQMEERKDAVSALDIPFPSRRRPSGATDALQLQLKGSPGSPQASSSPATLDSFSESECSDNVSFGTFGGLSDCSAADLAPGLEPNQIAGQEPVGEIELGLQMGVEASKQRSSFVLDILRGHNFKLWQNLDEKPGFEIYIKCYLIFPGRVIKMKTRQVAPGHQPEFLDQLISIMNKKLLQKAERLKIQLWEDHGSLKKKLAVGVATIDLTKIRMEELVMGCYPLYVPHRQASMPTTPTSPSVSVSPGSTPPSLTRSSSGRFGSLRNSFKRREKLRLRHSTSGTAPSSPLVSANVESSPPAAVLSSSAPTSAPSALSSTPTRGHRSRRESETGETDL
ncbi:uncharacterized protein LOC135822710 isoform X1 [Sycon ciliatum]|uniref:uncharacterized protein LOC135822710 isoform X1 n=1 Tax=Sycon ciliatum TaxID=27933 RepID=UPI0031F638C4